MPELKRGRYLVRFASSGEDVARAQALRGLAFRGDGSADADAHDAACRHLMIEEAAGGLVATLRLRVFRSGADTHLSYAAQYYDLSPLSGFPDAMVELGRFCLHPDRHDPDILRLAWGAITACVDQEQAGMLFGCVSFRGTDPSAYPDAFATLRANHLGPGRWLPGTKAQSVIRFGQGPEGRPANPRAAQAQMPPLLRSYLAMGGWVSDHAVVDAELDTMHVFTALEVDRVPAARARSLRLIAG
ncbi:MAG: GNAT family N-acetyltransferase [Proteobacteria bacterium]|nr:GNAT family N-acetyltransferase [Pseudomonadota bacterium]